MHIKRLAPYQHGSIAGLSVEARGVLTTLGTYGGTKGILLGGTKLNPSIQGGGNPDVCATIKTLTGKTPAIYKWMFLDPTQAFYAANSIATQAAADYEAGIAACIAHWEAGGIVAMSLMAPNLASGGDWNDRRRDDITPVTFLKVGSANTSVFNAWRSYLDKIADTLNNRLVDSKGRRIPVILHWFGECNGWYDFLPNEGLYPSQQVGGRVVTSIQRVSGQSYYQMTLEARAADYVPGMPGVGGTFQISGNADANWNTRYTVRTWDVGPPSDISGTGQTVTLTAWKGGAGPTGSPASMAGTIAYASNGSWAAGLDRAADLMIVIREAVTYLRGTKGVTSLISSVAPFPEQYWSSKETNTNAAGTPFTYTNWHPGDAFVDVGGANIYRPNSSPTLGGQSLVDSITKHRTNFGFKPFIFNELGLALEAEITPASAFRSQTNFWQNEWALMAAKFPFLSGACIWSSSFIPSATDVSFPGFAQLVQGNSCVTLDQLKRLV